MQTTPKHVDEAARRPRVTTPKLDLVANGAKLLIGSVVLALCAGCGTSYGIYLPGIPGVASGSISGRIGDGQPKPRRQGRNHTGGWIDVTTSRPAKCPVGSPIETGNVEGVACPVDVCRSRVTGDAIAWRPRAGVGCLSPLADFDGILDDIDGTIAGAGIVASRPAVRSTRRDDVVVSPCNTGCDEASFDPRSFRTNLVEIAMAPTCGWCRRQHKEVASMRRNGWDVRYVPFPLGGAESSEGRIMAVAKCSGDVYVDRLMETGDLDVDGMLCERGTAWVRDGRRRLESLGVHATPTLVIDGRLYEGYRTAEDFGVYTNK